MPNPSISRWVVIGPFVAAVVLLCATGALVVGAMSTVRAYVSGESLYSKGQKDAVYHLWRYARTQSETDFQAYRDAIAMPIGDRIAREEMNRASPDLALVRAGFLQGGNHPDDIDGLITVYRRLRGLPFIADAVAVWTEGDAAIAQLDALAFRLHEVVKGGGAGSPEMQRLLEDLPRLNGRLTVLEQRFSATLGGGSRQVQRWALWATFVLGAVLVLIGGTITWLLLARQAAAERALRTSSARWELAADAAGIGVFDWDMLRDSVTLDRRAAAICGMDQAVAQDVPAARVVERIEPTDGQALALAVRHAEAAGTPLEIRFRMRAPDHRTWHVELAGRVEPAADGRGCRVVGILWDVTSDVQREQLRLDKEAAERASTAKSAFLSRVSHELRTPLNAVLGFAQLLEHDPVEPLTMGQRQRIRHVLDSGSHLLALIDDVLDLTSAEQDAALREPVEVRLADALGASLMQVESLARAQEVTLVDHTAPGGANVLGEPKWLRQVFINLLSNAVKYNRRGGRVDIDLVDEEEHVLVRVRDTGIGMTPEQLGALFQPFNRLGAERSKVPGSGLGLVIVRQLLERMRATLEVESVRGEGSAFTVRLRRAATADTPPATPAVAPA